MQISALFVNNIDELLHEKTNTQSGQSLRCALKANVPSFLRADSEDSDQTVKLPRSLRWAHMSFYWFCRAQAHMYTAFGSKTLLLWFLTVICSCCPYLYFGSPIMLVTCFGEF